MTGSNLVIGLVIGLLLALGWLYAQREGNLGQASCLLLRDTRHHCHLDVSTSKRSERLSKGVR